MSQKLFWGGRCGIGVGLGEGSLFGLGCGANSAVFGSIDDCLQVSAVVLVVPGITTTT